MSKNPFRYFKSSPEIIQLVVMMYVRFPLSLRNVEDLLHERGIDICHETVRHWVDRFGTHFVRKIGKRRGETLAALSDDPVLADGLLWAQMRTLRMHGRRPKVALTRRLPGRM